MRKPNSWFYLKTALKFTTTKLGVSHLCLVYILFIIDTFTMARLKTCSLNVNGLQDETKRRNIFPFLKSQDCDIFFLQEVHMANSQERAKWTSEWEGQAFWSYGSSRARGVAILFKKNFNSNFNIVHQINDTEGRILTVCINIESVSIQLVNVYAPNQPQSE